MSLSDEFWHYVLILFCEHMWEETSHAGWFARYQTLSYDYGVAYLGSEP